MMALIADGFGPMKGDGVIVTGTVARAGGPIIT